MQTQDTLRKNARTQKIILKKKWQQKKSKNNFTLDIFTLDPRHFTVDPRHITLDPRRFFAHVLDTFPRRRDVE